MQHIVASEPRPCGLGHVLSDANHTRGSRRTVYIIYVNKILVDYTRAHFASNNIVTIPHNVRFDEG